MREASYHKKKEALALIEAIKHNRRILQSQEFTDHTESRTLNFLENLKADTGRLGRWSVFLQGVQVHSKRQGEY